MACEDGGLARRVAGADQFRSAPIYRSESPTGYSSAGCSPAEPASASPVTDNSSPNPIQRANQIALLNSTAGCRQTRAPRPLPSARGGCHLYFARRVTFLSCADNPGVARYPAEIDKNCIALHSRNQRADLVREAARPGAI